MNKVLAVVAGLLLAFVGCGANGLNRPRQKAWDATFALWGHANGQDHFLCTAAIIDRTPNGYKLLTAGHCVNPEELEAPPEITFTVAETMDDNATQYPVEVLKISPKRPNPTNEDYGILELKTNKRYPIEKIRDINLPKLGEPVYVIHFADGLPKQINEGQVSVQLITALGESGCPICQNRILIDVAAGGGASGALVISARTNRPIGILVGTVGMRFLVEPLALISY